MEPLVWYWHTAPVLQLGDPTGGCRDAHDHSGLFELQLKMVNVYSLQWKDPPFSRENQLFRLGHVQ